MSAREASFVAGPNKAHPALTIEQSARASSRAARLDVVWNTEIVGLTPVPRRRPVREPNRAGPGRWRRDVLMVRRIRYQEIADELRVAGHAARRTGTRCSHPRPRCLQGVRCFPGHGASEHLELVRDDGLISAARQGFGWFVATEPVRQRLDVARHDRVAGRGRGQDRASARSASLHSSNRRREFVSSSRPIRYCESSASHLADGEPFAVVTVWCPADLGASLSRTDVEQRPFYELARHVVAPRGHPDHRRRFSRAG